MDASFDTSGDERLALLITNRGFGMIRLLEWLLLMILAADEKFFGDSYLQRAAFQKNVLYADAFICAVVVKHACSNSCARDIRSKCIAGGLNGLGIQTRVDLVSLVFPFSFFFPFLLVLPHARIYLSRTRHLDDWMNRRWLIYFAWAYNNISSLLIFARDSPLPKIGPCARREGA